MDSRKNIYIAIFVITTIIAACLAVYFKIDGDRKSMQVVDNTSNVKTDVNTSETKVEVREVEKTVEKMTMLNYDYTKGKNVENINNYDGNIAKIAYINGNELYLFISKDGNATLFCQGKENIIDTNGKKARDGMIGHYYIYGLDCAFILLEDGQVERVNLDVSNNGVDIKDIKVYEDISNIVRVELVMNAGLKRLPVAIDENGNYYALN